MSRKSCSTFSTPACSSALIELFPYRNLSFLDPDRMDNLWKAHS
jgi:hypothetical protein